MPARPIIILLQQSTSPPVYTYLLRADVAVARQPLYAKPGYKSPFQPLAPDTDPDASALVSGAVVEITSVLTGGGGQTLPQIQAELVTRQTDYQAQITALTTWNRYGTFYNGTAWTPQGV
jgi:hypothetical protein